MKVYCKTAVGRACGLSSSSSAPLIPLLSSSLLCMSPRNGWLRLEMKLTFILLDSTPLRATFRIIIGTNTHELKCGYGQLPRQGAATNRQKISVLKLLVLSRTPQSARFASSLGRRMLLQRNARTASYRENKLSLATTM